MASPAILARVHMEHAASVGRVGSVLHRPRMSLYRMPYAIQCCKQTTLADRGKDLPRDSRSCCVSPRTHSAPTPLVRSGGNLYRYLPREIHQRTMRTCCRVCVIGQDEIENLSKPRCVSSAHLVICMFPSPLHPLHWRSFSLTILLHKLKPAWSYAIRAIFTMWQWSDLRIQMV